MAESLEEYVEREAARQRWADAARSKFYRELRQSMMDDVLNLLERDPTTKERAMELRQKLSAQT